MLGRFDKLGVVGDQRTFRPLVANSSDHRVCVAYLQSWYQAGDDHASKNSLTVA